LKELSHENKNKQFKSVIDAIYFQLQSMSFFWSICFWNDHFVVYGWINFWNEGNWWLVEHFLVRLDSKFYSRKLKLTFGLLKGVIFYTIKIMADWMLVKWYLMVKTLLFGANLPQLSEIYAVHDTEPFHDKYLALHCSVNVDLVFCCKSCILIVLFW
jgi:hypothetical protein